MRSGVSKERQLQTPLRVFSRFPSSCRWLSFRHRPLEIIQFALFGASNRPRASASPREGSQRRCRLRRACELGRHDEHSYRNDAGEDVTWRFVGLAELVELDDTELRDGSEILSSFCSTDAELLVRPRDLLD